MEVRPVVRVFFFRVSEASFSGGMGGVGGAKGGGVKG